jgi:uncharacterized cofD-like protein
VTNQCLLGYTTLIMDQQKGKNKKIVVIGGGTGTFVALSGLKKYSVQLSAIITMMDSGGSTGRLRDQLGVLPPGDLRQALVALSRSDKLWRDLFLYRFENGDLKGHNFGNIFISTLEKVTGSFEKALEVAKTILDSSGDVIPVTFSKSELCVELSNDRIIEGETHIDAPIEQDMRAPIKRAFLKPEVHANKKAVNAILSADLVVIGPGDLYTSIIPNLLVSGISDAINKSKAEVVFVMNLMTKYGQTTGFTASDHLADLEKYINHSVDTVIVNTEKPDDESLSWYEISHEAVVEDDLDHSKLKLVHSDLIDVTPIPQTPGDSIKRSLIRHDPDKLAEALISLL